MARDPLSRRLSCAEGADINIQPGSIVVISAFDDVPDHQFRVDEVHDDCLSGVALTGPLAGE